MEHKQEVTTPAIASKIQIKVLASQTHYMYMYIYSARLPVLTGRTLYGLIQCLRTAFSQR